MEFKPGRNWGLVFYTPPHSDVQCNEVDAAIGQTAVEHWTKLRNVIVQRNMSYKTRVLLWFHHTLEATFRGKTVQTDTQKRDRKGPGPIKTRESYPIDET